MENQTNIRRTKIIVAYLAFFGAAAFVFWYFTAPSATCFDQKLNQGEKEIDCGGPCSPCKEIVQARDISIDEIASAPGGNNTYDVVAKISNPNDSMGAKTFNYSFSIKDVSGTVIATSEGTSFILPSDTRYIAQLGLKTADGAAPASIDVTISDAQWDNLANVGKPQIGVYNKKFGAAADGNGSEVEGVIRNESSYDLKKIDVTIVLRDEKGKIVGINTTQRDSVRSKEQQDFHVSWPYPLGADVQKIDVDPQTNVFDLQNMTFAN